MYIVRETFIAKPGYAGKLAKMMKEEMNKWAGFKGYVMLDFATDYNKIVVEYELESLAEFEKMMQDMKKQQEKQQSAEPPEYTKLYQTGKREIFRVVE
jgi:hypothetical protein